jgi:glycosyl hydrolase family 9/cellulase-like Ig domain-containing protein
LLLVPVIMRRTLNAILSCSLIAVAGFSFAGQPAVYPSEDLLRLPAVGDRQLRILSPTMLELTLVTTKAPDPAPVRQWNFVDASGRLNPPPAAEFSVQADGRMIPVKAVGFKRRVAYAPLAKRDLRVGNELYLWLGDPIGDGQSVEVKNPGGKLWPAGMRFNAVADPLRYGAVIHVNQTGYGPAFPKTAMVGYYSGSLGELVLTNTAFQLIDARNGATVFTNALSSRRDSGYNYAPLPYQKVLAADFSEFKTPGQYRLLVPGCGASFPFYIDDGAGAAVARAYALGLYHQRCGTGNALPFTRFVHDPCHTAPAEVPTAKFKDAESFLAESANEGADDAQQSAPRLSRFAAGLYPFVRTGRVNVSGGHHDAGDYGKYTINSAGLVHALIFAADALPGVGALDNLGLPESGDGKSDLLQEARWEADFLAKMQDDDGGFYFLVYPRNRRYENNVLPDRGDAQIVWPKNTAATAAAVAALAQAASSPLFKQQFPADAARYLAQAKKGWAFLEQAIAKHGRNGAYQKLTHYGDDFTHDDELAWAACELFLATGDDALQQRFIGSFRPDDPAVRRWGWWRLYESYGRAMRSYAFAARTGRVPAERLDASFLKACEDELRAAADDQLRWAQESAYGTSFPTETKRFRAGGWYFSMDQAFDLAVASALDDSSDTRSKYLAAMLENLNYEEGCNPVNVCYLTGLGWKRQHEMVHHYAMNDRRVLPPSGLPLGNVQRGFAWLELYQKELDALSFPSDEADEAPYPIYDRWADSFNVQTEFVGLNQARGLAVAALLMARTPLKDQPWKAQAGSIELRTTNDAPPAGGIVALNAGPLDSREARVVWEVEGREPVMSSTLALAPDLKSSAWIEAEAQWPDGRRVFAATNLNRLTEKRR